MMRIDRIRSGGLKLRALVEAQQAPTAMDWCLKHEGQGAFDFTWAMSDANGRLQGLFYFEDPQDHTMFILRWG